MSMPNLPLLIAIGIILLLIAVGGIVVTLRVNQEKLSKYKIYAEIIASICLPVVLLYLGYLLNESYRAKEQQLKQVELNQKYIEIAVGILNSKPTLKKEPLRDWAIKIMDKYSEVKLTPEAKKSLKDEPLSPGYWPEGYWP